MSGRERQSRQDGRCSRDSRYERYIFYAPLADAISSFFLAVLLLIVVLDGLVRCDHWFRPNRWRLSRLPLQVEFTKPRNFGGELDNLLFMPPTLLL